MRMYSVSFSAVSISAVQDFFELVAASGKPIEIHMLELSQSSEVGDSAEEGLSVLIKTGQTASGTAGSSFTPVPMCVSDAAAGATAEINNTAKASGGTIVTKYSSNWNVRTPFIFLPPPECRPWIAGGERGTVELNTAPNDAITASGTILFAEHG